MLGDLDPPTALAHLPRASEQSSGALPLAVAAVALGLDQLVHHTAHRLHHINHLQPATAEANAAEWQRLPGLCLA